VATLCGPGGIGKTALASEAIWRLAPGDDLPALFPDGIIFHSFYNQPEAGLALEKIALAYGEPVRSSPRDAVQRALAGRVALLFLDGAEQADDLRLVLDVRDRSGVLVTSRSHKDAPAGRQDIPPLPLEQAMNLLRAWGGVRARDESAARKICELVGGLPLAVRMVGRYMYERGEDAPDYLTWLEQTPLQALDHGKRRQESVRVLLEHSLAQVSSPSQEVLPVVGLLALAPFSREVVAVALELNAGEVGRPLGELVSYGLLHREVDRYQVSHALIHTYARECCPPPKKAAGRIAAYYDEFVRQQEGQGLEGYALLEAERPHWMRSLLVCVERGEWQAARSLARVVDNYLDLSGHWTDRVSAVRAGLESARQLGERRDEGAFLGNLGLAYAALGETRRAIENYEQALAISREIGDRRGESTHSWNLGLVYEKLGKLGIAVQFMQFTVDFERELRHPDAEQDAAQLEELRARWTAMQGEEGEH